MGAALGDYVAAGRELRGSKNPRERFRILGNPRQKNWREDWWEGNPLNRIFRESEGVRLISRAPFSQLKGGGDER